VTGSGLLEDAWSFLLELDGASLVLFFWFTLLIELPRYMLGSVVVALTSLFERSKRVSLLPAPRVSVVVAGHNEADVLERCVRGLHEQTLAKRAELFEIIVVSDG
jgi:biofilm PGA synthesis N-glycosyltransferase PgaC